MSCETRFPRQSVFLKWGTGALAGAMILSSAPAVACQPDKAVISERYVTAVQEA